MLYHDNKTNHHIHKTNRVAIDVTVNSTSNFQGNDDHQNDDVLLEIQ